MTPTFRVIDKYTGREYLEENINTDGLLEMDLDQMFLGEDGTLVMADDCGRIAYQDGERFDVVIDGYVSIDRVLEIIDNEIQTVTDEATMAFWLTRNNACESIKRKVLALMGGEQECQGKKR